MHAAAQEYGFSPQKKTEVSELATREESRAMHEVQAAFVIAKRFPRDESIAFSKIVKACERPLLAEMALYAYPKAGKNVTGPSIRLAEMLVQYWGNCNAGIREISQANGISVCEAYASDLETNTHINKVFHVAHKIGTKQGMKTLSDPRDIYELVANQGARRMRACILAIIPGDVIDAAVVKCKHTMVHKGEPLIDKLRKLGVAFEEIGVKIPHIERKLGHKFDITTAEEVADLRTIYKSIKDGMASRTDFFDIGSKSDAAETVSELIKGKKVQSEAGAIESVLIKKNIREILQEVHKQELEEATEAIEKSIMYVKVKGQIDKAKSIDTLHLAGDLIRSCEEDEREELTELYKEKELYLSGGELKNV